MVGPAPGEVRGPGGGGAGGGSALTAGSRLTSTLNTRCGSRRSAVISSTYGITGSSSATPATPSSSVTGDSVAASPCQASTAPNGATSTALTDSETASP